LRGGSRFKRESHPSLIGLVFCMDWPFVELHVPNNRWPFCATLICCALTNPTWAEYINLLYLTGCHRDCHWAHPPPRVALLHHLQGLQVPILLLPSRTRTIGRTTTTTIRTSTWGWGLPTVTNPWNGTLQLLEGAIPTRPGKLGLYGTCPDIP
jgi:hypothetical protein